MIVGGQILEPIGKWCIEKMHIPTQSFGWKLWQRIRTFVLFSASISFSWSASMKDGFRMWARCFKPTNLSSLLPLASRADWFLLVIGTVIIWLISYGKQKEDVRMYVAKKALPVRWILYLVLLFACLDLRCLRSGLRCIILYIWTVLGVHIENETKTHNKNHCISSGGGASLWGSGAGA